MWSCVPKGVLGLALGPSRENLARAPAVVVVRFCLKVCSGKMKVGRGLPRVWLGEGQGGGGVVEREGPGPLGWMHSCES